MFRRWQPVSVLARFGVSALWTALAVSAMLAAVGTASAATNGKGPASPSALPDSIAVSVRGDLTPSVIATLQSIIGAQQAKSAVVQQGTIDLTTVRRPAGTRTSTTVQSAPEADVIPLSATAINPAAALALYGPAVSDALATGNVVLGATSAKLRQAKIGDILDVDDWFGPPLSASLAVGAIVPDDRIGGAELMISTATATFIHLDRPARVVAWGMAPSRRDRLASALEAVVTPAFVRRSWIAPTNDAVLAQSALKALLGEFAIQRAGNNLSVDPAWLKTNVARATLPIIGPITCHRAIVEHLRAALTEIEQAGLAGLINVADTRRSGGCFNGREVRTISGVNGHNLSRHSWGAAVDINPSANRFGATPNMDPRIVDVFRRQGFAWGGTWAVPDGMHFEFIGTPRVVGPPLPTAPPTTLSTSTTSTTTSPTTAATTTTRAPAATTSISASNTTSSTSPKHPTTTRTTPTTTAATTASAGSPTTASTSTTSTTTTPPPPSPTTAPPITPDGDIAAGF